MSKIYPPYNISITIIMVERSIINNHITTISIAIFILAYGIIHSIKPSFLFNKDGSLREFGVGFRKKTIIPSWLMSIVLAIICYFSVLYYVASPRLEF
jgi:hypothetical protein